MKICICGYEGSGKDTVAAMIVNQYQFTQHAFADNLKKALTKLHNSAKVDCLNALSETYLKFDRDTTGYYSLPLYPTKSSPTFSRVA